MGLTALVTLGIGLLWWGADALIVTDEERLEALVDLATSPLDGEVITAAAEWTDPGRQPVEVSAFGMSRVYGAGSEEDLAAMGRSSLSPYYGTSFRDLSRSIEVEDDHGAISMRLMSDQGMVQVRVQLVKHGDDWLVAQLRVGR